MKTFLMVWSVFNYLLTQKLPTKAKVALGCSQYVYTKSCWKRKSCSKVVEHNLFMPKHEGVDVRTIFSEPKFLGSVDYHIFLPMVLRCARFARARTPLILFILSMVHKTLLDDQKFLISSLGEYWMRRETFFLIKSTICIRRTGQKIWTYTHYKHAKSSR